MANEKVFVQPLSDKYTITLNSVFGDRFTPAVIVCETPQPPPQWFGQ
jgi:hypothetical protein